MSNVVIVTIVNQGFADDVMEAARAAGARGGTILHARGAGSQEAERFFGITIQPEKEAVLIVTSEQTKTPIMQAIARQAGLNTRGHGISFTLPVEDVIGLTPFEE